MTTNSELVHRAFDEVMHDHEPMMRQRGWPNLDVVSRVELRDPSDIFRAGRRCNLTNRRWVPGLKEYVYFVPEWPPGNVVKVASRNVVGIVEPRYRAECVVVITYGCAHQLETVTVRPCYTEQRCTECGMHYGVDSSG